jgi:hypothetical protein
MAKKMLQCSNCGETKLAVDFFYHRARGEYMKTCKKCNTKICGAYIKKRRAGPDSYKQKFTERAAERKRYAKSRGIPVMNKLGRHLMDLWEKQAGLCHYTQRKMDLDGYHQRNINAVSIDRIDPNKGYVEGNVVLCCTFINRMKNYHTWEELISQCKEILRISERFSK